MSTKGIFYLTAGFGSFCLIILLFRLDYFNGPFKYQLQMSTAALLQRSPQSIAVSKEDDGISQGLQSVVDQQQKMIRESMTDYEYPRGKYDVKAEKLEDLLINENGRPVRSVILSTWRSGSTFLGDILNAHPGNFYHYEPLLDFDIVQIRGPPLVADAIKRVKDLLSCDYTDHEEYIEYCKTQSWVLYYNTHLWRECKVHKKMCYNHKFFSEICKVFPFQLMKLVRLRLNVAQELLEDENLGVRMVLLVRDPRGTIQSRKHREWCPNGPDCSDPALLCADLSSDYITAIELLKKYPTRFRVMRYEDLSAAPYQRAKELTQFYGLNFDKNMKKFLDTHTKNNVDEVWSTFRDTKSAPYHWRTELTFEEVEEIERYCRPAMKQWGYLPAMNETHQRTFNPVTKYVVDSSAT